MHCDALPGPFDAGLLAGVSNNASRVRVDVSFPPDQTGRATQIGNPPPLPTRTSLLNVPANSVRTFQSNTLCVAGTRRPISTNQLLRCPRAQKRESASEKPPERKWKAQLFCPGPEPDSTHAGELMYSCEMQLHVHFIDALSTTRVARCAHAF